MAVKYVRKSGSDANDGSTPALAKLTIQAMITAMSSGDTIWIGAGKYHEQLNNGAKMVYLKGDITGANTGDAGEVIISGAAANDASISAVDYAVKWDSSYSYGLEARDIIWENWRLNNLGSVIGDQRTITNISVIRLYDCKFRNIFGYTTDTDMNIAVISINCDGYPSFTLERILIENVRAHTFRTSSDQGKKAYVYGIYTNCSITTNWAPTYKNIEIRNMFAISECASAQTGVFNWNAKVYGLYHSFSGNTQSYPPTIQNLTIHNLIACSLNDPNSYGMFLTSGAGSWTLSDCQIHDIAACGGNGGSSTGIYCSYGGAANNCSVFNIYKNNSAGTTYATITPTNCSDLFDYYLPEASKKSRFSPNRGLGYGTYPTTDINNNPRPAYGNTNGDIGAVENILSDVQRESTIIESGTYSLKVHPCNYFKKNFQIPTTASTARTVKIKIRIDGTFISRPKVTLSGMGISSTVTKNATTGAFEELTVSGTASSTGIAILTIEAHATNIDAYMYIDSVTIS